MVITTWGKTMSHQALQGECAIEPLKKKKKGMVVLGYGVRALKKNTLEGISFQDCTLSLRSKALLS
jgi:hypothetical protein